jgi:hypothetical protein
MTVGFKQELREAEIDNRKGGGGKTDPANYWIALFVFGAFVLSITVLIAN